MNHYKRIQQAIEFIEAHLQEELLITDIAAEACFSAFHFQRLFQLISGFSVHEYIRKRRLTEAAKLLKESDGNILEIALAFQYGSQEAFTRAFTSCFGLTPAKYRKTHATIHPQSKIDFLDHETWKTGEMTMDKPVIAELEKLLIIGYEYKTNLNNDKYFQEIPGFYHHFGSNEFFLRIPHKAKPAFSYGISCNFQDNGDFSFVVGEEVHQHVEQLEEGFVQMELPAGKYAIFTVNGQADGTQNIWKYIYGTWLPQSNYERREGPDFEVTDVLGSRFPHDMRMKIYIPIQ
ncbi:effector binding domain-containing protein [Brevibacillus migulae]|uniref:effector binding domain-containing protein n=1 Tax=Brevibacillus migulae TaxID=1644114 RepID=UPI00106E94DD|nr:effector binding domain-containing protein [Brevibacillus migulae]